jgi:hypothetical protein
MRQNRLLQLLIVIETSLEGCFMRVDRFAIAGPCKSLFAAGAGGAIAEVGLLPIAGIALEVAKAVLPPYPIRFSKHQFTRPKLVAILSLMGYKDWTFREGEVRLGEHRMLRRALGLSGVSDFTTIYSYLAATRRSNH